MSEISLPLQQKRSQRSLGTIRTDKDVFQTILFNEEKRLNYYEKKLGDIVSVLINILIHWTITNHRHLHKTSD